MSGEADLAALLASMSPKRRPGVFVFATVSEPPSGAVIEASVREPEGLSIVVERDAAAAAGLDYEFEAAWITLEVHSALDAVGLTAAVSTALAAAGISCNVIAGRHHDHLLVPLPSADDALAVLRGLAEPRAEQPRRPWR